MPARVVLITAAMILAACAEDSTGSTNDSTVDNTPTAAQTSAPGDTTASTTAAGTAASTTAAGTAGGSTPMDNGSIDKGLQPYIDIALADLAQQLSIDVSQITVVSATLQQWSDASLGCPQPGMQYAQVETDGSLIVLSAGGKTYDYHSGGSRKPFLCTLTTKDTSKG